MDGANTGSRCGDEEIVMAGRRAPSRVTKRNLSTPRPRVKKVADPRAKPKRGIVADRLRRLQEAADATRRR